MKKICFVTAARSEYGLLKWLMKEVENSDSFELQLIVTGAHLLDEQGHTIETIREDGFNISEVVDAQLDTSSKEEIAASMGRMGSLFSHSFARLKPDYVVVLGDRYELLPVVNSAFIMRIPVIHISGGDITEGAIDDGIRNAVTMLADYHFPGIESSAENIKRMRGSDKNIWAVGEPGLDSFNRETLMTREELAAYLGLDIERKWVLFTFHAETKQSTEYNLTAVENCLSALTSEDNTQIIATYSNADFGGKHINDYLQEVSQEKPGKVIVIPSLGTRRYFSLMKQVVCVAGNSSSGIVEAPTLGVPVINVGDRQKGRHQCKNVIQTSTDIESISNAIEEVKKKTHCVQDFYWGDGHTAERIIMILEKEL